jgi:uridine kinase
MGTDGAVATGRAVVIAQVAGILRARAPGHPLRVAVDGITSSGKTTFASEIAEAVSARGRPVARVSMDGYHHRRAHRHRQGRLSADGYYEDAYDLDRAARALLQPLGPGGTRRYRDRIIDLATDEPTNSWAEAAPETVLVVDGSFLQRAELRDHWDEVIYLDVAGTGGERGPGLAGVGLVGPGTRG